MKKFLQFSVLMAFGLSFFNISQAYQVDLGTVSRDFLGNQSLQVGDNYLWVDGSHFGAVQSGDEVVISNDGTRAGENAEVQQVRYVIVQRDRTRLTFNDMFDMRHSMNEVVRVDYRPIVEEGPDLGIAYRDRNLTITNLNDATILWVAGDQTDKLELVGEITLEDMETGFNRNFDIKSATFHSGNTLIALEDEINPANFFSVARVVVEPSGLSGPNPMIGTAFGNVIRQTNVLAGSRVLWFRGRQYRRVKPGDRLLLGSEENREEFEVSNVLVWGNSTRVALKTPIQSDHSRSFAQAFDPEAVIPLEIYRADSILDETTVVAGIDNLTVMELKLKNHNYQDINLTSLTLEIDGQDAAVAYEDYTGALFLNGVQQGSSQNFKTPLGGEAIFNNLNVVIVAEDLVQLEVVFDTLESLTDGDDREDSFKVTVEEGEGDIIETGENVGLERTQRVRSAEFIFVEESAVVKPLEITRVDSIPNGTVVVAGVDDLTTMEFEIENDNDQDMNLTSISAEISGSDAASVYTNYATALFINGIQQGSSKFFQSNGEVTFNDLSVVIAGNDLAEFELILDTLESSADGDADPDTFQVSVVEGEGDIIETGKNVDFEDDITSAEFRFVQTGDLTIENGDLIGGDLTLESGAIATKVWKIRFFAEDDDIEITDLYLRNIGTAQATQVEFSLKDEDNAFLSFSEYLINGDLHFEFSNADRIHVPKGSSTMVKIKARVEANLNPTEIGKTVQLAFDKAEEQDGIEAVTTATGADLKTDAVTNTATMSRAHIIIPSQE